MTLTTASDTLPVITGMGVVAPNGLGRQAFWEALRSGRSGLRPIERFDAGDYPVRIAGEVTDFTVAEHIPSRLIPSTDRSTQFALACSDWALADAGVVPTEMGEFDGSVVTANALGGVEFIQHELQSLWSKGPRHVTAYMSYAWFYGVNTGQISIRHQLKGPSGVVVTGQAGGLDALGAARRKVRDGRRYVVTGGADAPICPYGIAAELTTGLLSSETDPSAAYLPFDRRASGHVPGEGAAMMIIESLWAARERGATQIYGAITGYGATFDPAPDSGRPPTLDKAIRIALGDAGLSAADIDVVFADGAATTSGDSLEADAIVSVFGPRGVPVSVPKTTTGRMYGASGAIDVVTALLSLRANEIPPTVGSRELVAEHAIDLVTALRSTPLTHALVLARDSGGFNAAVVVSRLN
ncbi:ketosynthase chain-length factor [Nocardia sp. ET3-3]|uniref:Ketosynthase chain-length factor n=1 Tax=Nocardia terrae TaxID=2675851 RepID=A0A7K1V4B2_9NOCA|nr:ketosynthase chain-length factor [Nocardia terrae]MVU81322.1 ketosynthase chain-length factor [Nocardia terrae]